jgi:mRNA interferase RelE/StbE
LTPSDSGYQLKFIPAALIEWRKLDNSIRKPLIKRLERRLENPVVENDRLSGDLSSCYKIKDNKSGYRMVYVIKNQPKELVVLAVGWREDLAAYDKARDRLAE